VDDMVSTGDQCNLIPSPGLLSPESQSSPTTTESPLPQLQTPLSVDDGVDEGFFDGDEDDHSLAAVQRIMMDVRRSRGPASVRKYISVQRLRTGSNYAPQNGGLVYPPRIRKKICKRRPFSS